MKSIRQQVLEFHRAAKAPVLETPQVPPDSRMRLRLSLIAEEFGELLEAALGKEVVAEMRVQLRDLVGDSRLQVDVPALADAMADLDYVVEGTRLECGINGEPIAAEVHRANMAKFGPGHWVRGDGKVMKPPDWKPPDIQGVLKRQGWKPDDGA